ncbi:MAG: hypothetical protein ABI361_00010 [Nitrososphaera sp.]
MTKIHPLRSGAIICGSVLVAVILLVLALPAVVAVSPTISDLTSNKNATATAGTLKITQNWAQSDTVSPGIAQTESAFCKNNEAVIGGGYQISGPDGTVLFTGPSLQLNAYAVQLVNHGQSTMQVQVYATCAS